MDPQIRFCTKISWIRNTTFFLKIVQKFYQDGGSQYWHESANRGHSRAGQAGPFSPHRRPEGIMAAKIPLFRQHESSPHDLETRLPIPKNRSSTRQDGAEPLDDLRGGMATSSDDEPIGMSSFLRGQPTRGFSYGQQEDCNRLGIIQEKEEDLTMPHHGLPWNLYNETGVHGKEKRIFFQPCQEQYAYFSIVWNASSNKAHWRQT
jgi:hypothetical protein